MWFFQYGFILILRDYSKRFLFKFNYFSHLLAFQSIIQMVLIESICKFFLNLCLHYVETLTLNERTGLFLFRNFRWITWGYNNFREQYRNSRGRSDETSHFAFSNFWCVNFATHGPCVIAIEDCTFFSYSPFFFFRTIPRDNLIKLFPRPIEKSFYSKETNKRVEMIIYLLLVCISFFIWQVNLSTILLNKVTNAWIIYLFLYFLFIHLVFLHIFHIFTDFII